MTLRGFHQLPVMLLLFAPVFCWANCASAPTQLHVMYTFDVAISVPHQLVHDGCSYELISEDNIQMCAMEDATTRPVKCSFDYYKNEDSVDPDNIPDFSWNDATYGSILPKGCGSITTPASGTKNYCWYRPLDEQDNPITPHGWHETDDANEDPAGVTPGTAPDDIRVYQDECPSGFTKMRNNAGTELCVKDSAGGAGYIMFRPATNPDDTQSDDPNAVPQAGVCEDGSTLIFCQDDFPSEYAVPSYDADTVETFIGGTMSPTSSEILGIAVPSYLLIPTGTCNFPDAVEFNVMGIELNVTTPFFCDVYDDYLLPVMDAVLAFFTLMAVYWVWLRRTE